MNKIVKGFVATMLTGLVAFSCVTAYAAKTAVSKNYLYVLHSKNAKIVSNNHAYTVVMPNTNVVYFTDRPVRQSGKISVAKFMKIWNGKNSNSFKNNPPNAYIAGLDVVTPGATQKSMNNVVTITDPVLKNNVLAFKVTANSNKKLKEQSNLDLIAFVDSSCNVFTSGSSNCV